MFSGSRRHGNVCKHPFHDLLPLVSLYLMADSYFVKICHSKHKKREPFRTCIHKMPECTFLSKRNGTVFALHSRNADIQKNRHPEGSRHLLHPIVLYLLIGSFVTEHACEASAKPLPGRQCLNHNRFLPYKTRKSCHKINMASPKEKKRYFSRTASSYAASTFSRPARALTSMISVDSGR